MGSRRNARDIGLGGGSVSVGELVWDLGRVISSLGGRDRMAIRLL